MKNEDYVSYELALKLKACGFDEPCRCCYVVDKDSESNIEFTEYASRSEWNSAKVGGLKYPYKHISAPLLFHAQKWLREKKGIAINVIAHDASDKYREENIIGWRFICRTATKMVLNGWIGLSTASIRCSTPTRRRYRTDCRKCWN